jgi:adenine-specific DNA-methyltransferase
MTSVQDITRVLVTLQETLIQLSLVLKAYKPVQKITVKTVKSDITPKRLNYIGSKHLLLDWLTQQIQTATGAGLSGKRIADLFGGTGSVSYHFRTLGATVTSNDVELYSSIITHTLTRGVYTPQLQAHIDTLNKSLSEEAHKDTVGFMTTHYSPHGAKDRKFFTVDNARRVDYVRQQIELLRLTLSVDEHAFLLASLLYSADNVANVPAVYGCFLKNFKKTAEKPLMLVPIHKNTVPSEASKTTNEDILNKTFLESLNVDILYLDPPYNERQYSKNYFPLNVLAKTPAEQAALPELTGKTGIPQDCFNSPFCRKAQVKDAFELIFKHCKAPYIFLSYNSESLIQKADMLTLMGKYGTVSVVERDYKRFKSFEYNEDKKIVEYLFCLKKPSN